MASGPPRPLHRSTRHPGQLPQLSTDSLHFDSLDYGNQDEDDQQIDLESASMLSFPPRPTSPLLPSPSRAVFPPHRSDLGTHSSYYRSSNRPNRSRLFKFKLSCRWFRMPALILLCTTVIVSFVFVPWHQSRSDLDLNRLRTLENLPDHGFLIHNISAPDGSIYGSFVGLGASLQSLFVKDRHGSFRDIVLGHDNTSEYLHHPAHPRFGSVVGRYANRIKNSSFILPGKPDQVFHTTPNEHHGLNTLHGGFPGRVASKIEYELLSGGKWKIRMTAEADNPTPLMLSSHVYWNLDAYSSDESASKHYLKLNAPNYLPVDAILVPTGQIESVSRTPLDFTEPIQIGARLNQAVGLCGEGCTGYDNALVYASARSVDEPAMEMWSHQSGIKMSVFTDQVGVQIYSCNGIVSKSKAIRPITRKKSQAGPRAIYENYSCIVIEQQSLIDAINHPSWQVDSIYGPDRPYDWNAVYEFSVL